jgi:ribosomal protein S27AE
VSLSGICLIHYTVEGLLLGTQSIYACGFSDSGQSYSAYWPHRALFCPHCGKLWARLEYIQQFDYQPVVQKAWCSSEQPCRACGDGSVLQHDDLKEVSPELLRYELEILLNKELNNG